jgi:Lrp/AsnC family transcriptional regulator, regulator for asnA, asnC and gidA
MFHNLRIEKGNDLKEQTRIDETDAIILKTLLVDSRTSLTEISKSCKITVGAVRMRIMRLKKDGVIKGEVVLVNPHSLGYKCVVDLGIKTSVEHEKEVADFLRAKLNKANVVGAFAKYNVFAVAPLKDIHELAGLVENLESHPHVKHVESMIWAEAVRMEHMERLVIKPLKNDLEKSNLKKVNAISLEEVELDEIDRQIAKMVSQNARMSFNRIAKQLGISTKNVIKRYNRLKGSVLTSSTIVVNLKKLGFNAFAFLFIKVTNRSKMPDIYAQILQVPNAVVAFRLLGHYDLTATIFLESFGELFEATEQVRKIPGIDFIDTYVTAAWDEWPPNLFHSLL